MVLTFKQRLTLFHQCDVLFADVAEWNDDSIDFDCFLKHHVKAKHLLCAQVYVNELFKRGVDSIQKLKELSFDSLHLTCPSFCSNCVQVYGVDATRDGFIVAPMDCVAVSGSPAFKLLQLTMKQLLIPCIGFPQCANAVLQQQVGLVGAREALRGLDTLLLLDSGIRAKSMLKYGVEATHLREMCGCTTQDLEKLGF